MECNQILMDQCSLNKKSGIVDTSYPICSKMLDILRHMYYHVVPSYRRTLNNRCQLRLRKYDKLDDTTGRH